MEMSVEGANYTFSILIVYANEIKGHSEYNNGLANHIRVQRNVHASHSKITEKTLYAAYRLNQLFEAFYEFEHHTNSVFTMDIFRYKKIRFKLRAI